MTPAPGYSCTQVVTSVGNVFLSNKQKERRSFSLQMLLLQLNGTEIKKKYGENHDISCQPSAAAVNHAVGSQDAALTSHHRGDAAVCFTSASNPQVSPPHPPSEAESMNEVDCAFRFIRDAASLDP